MITADQAIVTVPTLDPCAGEFLCACVARQGRRRARTAARARQQAVPVAGRRGRVRKGQPPARPYRSHRHGLLSSAAVRPAADRGLFGGTLASDLEAGGPSRSSTSRCPSWSAFSAAPSPAGSSSSRCIAGAPTLIRAARILTRCQAKPICERCWRRLSTTGSSSRAKRARSMISRPRTAAGSPSDAADQVKAARRKRGIATMYGEARNIIVQSDALRDDHGG